MKKSLGSKRKEISDEQREELIQSYLNFQESEISKIYDNKFLDTQRLLLNNLKKMKMEILLLIEVVILNQIQRKEIMKELL